MNPNKHTQPIRLQIRDAAKPLQPGDYLRIHHSPRRFPALTRSNWQLDSLSDSVVVADESQGTGYVVVNKPAGVPVHPSVDNYLENAAAALGRSLLLRDEVRLRSLLDDANNDANDGDDNEDVGGDLQTQTKPQKRQRQRHHQHQRNYKQTNDNPLVYVVAPQRLDQNTSGLFVLATQKSFASYFAMLLRNKTDAVVDVDVNMDTNQKRRRGRGRRRGGIDKKYKCLVCIRPNNEPTPTTTTTTTTPQSSSMWTEVDRLYAMAQNNTIVRHFLEPSIKAPKRFVTTLPKNQTESESETTWPECLLKITNVGDAVPVVGSESCRKLSFALWGGEGNSKYYALC